MITKSSLRVIAARVRWNCDVDPGGPLDVTVRSDLGGVDPRELGHVLVGRPVRRQPGQLHLEGPPNLVDPVVGEVARAAHDEAQGLAGGRGINPCDREADAGPDVDDTAGGKRPDRLADHGARDLELATELGLGREVSPGWRSASRTYSRRWSATRSERRRPSGQRGEGGGRRGGGHPR